MTFQAHSLDRWEKAYDEGVPRHLVYPEVPLHSLLERTARERPHTVATIFGGAVAGRCVDAAMTYREVDELADRFAVGLQRLGVRKGDRVALVLPNCPQFVYTFFGTLKSGAVVVPTNPLYTVRELHNQLADSGARVVVVISRLYPQVAEAAAGTSVERIVVTNVKEHFPFALRLLFTLLRERKEGHRVDISGDARAVWLRDVLGGGGARVAVEVAPSDLAVLQYTGGTTGVPKGAMLSHRALVANVHQCHAWHSTVGEGDRILAIMPFFHVYGLTVVMSHAVLKAMTMVLIPRPELRHIFLAIEKHRPRFFPGAPRIYVLLNESRDLAKYDLRSIEWFLSGSAPLPLEVMQRFEQLTGGKMLEGYGLTEAAPVTHSNPREGPRKPGSVGIPMPDVDCKIVDLETGTREVDPGEPGELCVRGPNLMDGYWNRPEETALVLRDGWLHTGDIVRMDEDGYFFVVDRKKEMIIVSGFKVYPREVDEVLYAHPAVLEAAAVGVPHASKGEVVKAFVVLRPGMTATAEEIVDHCRASLAPYKVPVAVAFRDELPKSLIGKILRRQLAEAEPEVVLPPLPRAS
ncbi:MAG TPA: long-chain fatty acid--CoA ligase [Candidatus Limnocylindria bacterium]|nr:long-chain fatty acid--CoA ligase [Candidatus Limnocylindria bacterium]